MALKKNCKLCQEFFLYKVHSKLKTVFEDKASLIMETSKPELTENETNGTEERETLYDEYLSEFTKFYLTCTKPVFQEIL